MKPLISLLALAAQFFGCSLSLAGEKGSAAVEIRKVMPGDDEILEEWERVTSEPSVFGVGAVRAKHTPGTWQVFVHAAEFVRGGDAEAQLDKAVTTALRGVRGVNAVVREDREVWKLEGNPKGDDLVRACAAAIDVLAPEIRKHLAR